MTAVASSQFSVTAVFGITVWGVVTLLSTSAIPFAGRRMYASVSVAHWINLPNLIPLCIRLLAKPLTLGTAHGALLLNKALAVGTD